jgi:hypothetical protein
VGSVSPHPKKLKEITIKLGSEESKAMGSGFFWIMQQKKRVEQGLYLVREDNFFERYF